MHAIFVRKTQVMSSSAGD